jgi:hypothetical protein
MDKVQKPINSEYYRNIKSRRMRGAEHVARMGQKRSVYRILMGKSEGKETTRKT